jgi:heme o synthase
MSANFDSAVQAFVWRDYLELCKPRVVALMLLTVLVGMFLASPGCVSLPLVIASLVGIGCTAGSAAAINHLVDRRIDAIMTRTSKRPVARGRVSVKQAIYFALMLGISGLAILVFFVNILTAVLSFITLIGYAGVYTGYLKRATPQNIVIGGLAGAAPPLLGWTAVTRRYCLS